MMLNFEAMTKRERRLLNIWQRKTANLAFSLGSIADYLSYSKQSLNTYK